MVSSCLYVSVHQSIHPFFCLWSVYLYVHFQMITSVNVNGFSANLVCALISWRSGLGLLMGKFRQFFLTDLFVWDTSDFSFLDNNLSKYQWIFTKLDMCIDIVEICFGIAKRQISTIFDRVNLPGTHPYFRFQTIT